MTTTHSYVDGNELGGALREVFAIDMTTARTQCGGCGLTGTIAETRVYDRAPGLVARCPGCEAVMLRLVRGPGRLWIDLRGTTYLEIDVSDQVTA